MGPPPPPAVRPSLLCNLSLCCCRQLGRHPRATADSISHEVGHTFGLAHFGGSGSEPYNQGSGPWGPLLGLPYARALSQWSRGTAITGTLQDDLHLIALQLPSLADDHGDNPASATPLCQRTQGVGSYGLTPTSSLAAPVGSCKLLKRGAGRSPEGMEEQGLMVRASVRGVISGSRDEDWFKIVMDRPGPMHVTLQLPSSVSGYGVNNLLASVVITAEDGMRLAAVQPNNGSEVLLQATAQLAVAGTYFVSVAPTALAGVSKYGSMGDYLLSVTFAIQQAQTGTAPGVQAPYARAPTAGSNNQQGGQRHTDSMVVIHLVQLHLIIIIIIMLQGPLQTQ